MGWYFTYGASRRDILEEILREHTWERPEEGRACKPLRHCAKGNVLWIVVESTKPDKVDRYIGCYLLQRSSDGWGYKPMDESMGPCYYTCPLSYLDMCTEPVGYAREWREKVREHHKAKAERRV